MYLCWLKDTVDSFFLVLSVSITPTLQILLLRIWVHQAKHHPAQMGPSFLETKVQLRKTTTSRKKGSRCYLTVCVLLPLHRLGQIYLDHLVGSSTCWKEKINLLFLPRSGYQHSSRDGDGPVWNDWLVNIHQGSRDRSRNGTSCIRKWFNNTRSQSQLSWVSHWFFFSTIFSFDFIMQSFITNSLSSHHCQTRYSAKRKWKMEWQ